MNTIEAAFWSRVDRGQPDDCWLWRGARDQQGYGKVWFCGISLRANRLAYELGTGSPLGANHALHKCDNPPCCNPAHLYAGTVADNNRDCRQRGRHSNGDRRGFPSSAKIDENMVRVIRGMLASGKTVRGTAAELGIGRGTVGHISSGRAWSHVK